MKWDGLQFNINNKKIIYEILSSYIKEEYLKAEEEKVKLINDKNEKEKELDELQKKSRNLEKEYLDKEKQISTFLECKKTFFGRVKYFFKYKKVNLTKKQEDAEKKQDIKLVMLNKYPDTKSNYTLDELIELYKQIDKEDIKVKNLKLDIKALSQRIKNLENKTKNATIYIEEINRHKKSIFEFWRFTNKDKVSELPEGENISEVKETLRKVFDYEMDFEDFSIKLDELQRNNLTNKELESLYLASTYVLEDINKVAKGEKITVKELENIKDKALKENSLIDKENFDIFSGMEYEDKIKTLANKRHREAERKIFSILDINKNTTPEEYEESIKEIIKNLNTAYEKIKTNVDIPVYKLDEKKITSNKFNRCNIKASEAVNNSILSDKNVFNLYKINLKESTPILAYTNIAYFENSNKTLPLGMNVSKEILLNNDLMNLEFKSKQTENIVVYENSEDELSEITIKTINIEEYDCN